jgi:CRP-like cAMP-binding protein
MTSNTLPVNDLYAGLSVALRKELAGHERFLTVPAGTRLAEYGMPADQLIIIHSGRAKTHVLIGGKNVSLSIAGPGTVFGLCAVLADAPLDRGLTCLERCEVAVLPKKAFLDVLDRNPQMYFAVVKVLSADLACADRVIRSQFRAANGKARQGTERVQST